MNVALSTRSVPIGELTFDVRVTGAGDGPAVVLLHGFPESSASWIPVARRLTAAGLRTFAPDQRGYSRGARPAQPHEYRLAALTADVVKLCDAMELESVHLAGDDWGAIVAWDVAARHPDRVDSLTAVSVPHPAAFAEAIATDPAQRETSSYMEVLAAPGTEDVLAADGAAGLRLGFGTDVPTELADLHLALVSQPGAMTAALNWYREARRDWPDVPPVRVPTTFVWGTEEIAVVRSATTTCAKYVEADYAFVELDGIATGCPSRRRISSPRTSSPASRAPTPENNTVSRCPGTLFESHQQVARAEIPE